MMMRRYITAIVIVVVMAQGMTPSYAQTTAPVSMSEVYARVFEDSGPGAGKEELITMFERHFAELVDDIKTTATKAEEKQLVQFLGNEMNHLAEVLPLKQEDPDGFADWVRIKQKDYGAVILGRKIQAIHLGGAGREALESHQKKLKALLAEVLEAKLAKERKDIADLERRLTELKKIQQIRTRNKNKILQNRYDELVGHRRLFRW